MKIKALVNFAGAFSMSVDEERDIPEGPVLDDLLRAGYVEKVQAEKKTAKVVKKNESK